MCNNILIMRSLEVVMKKIAGVFYIFGVLLLCAYSTVTVSLGSEGITPYKFTDAEYRYGMPHYYVPHNSRFTVPRACEEWESASDIVYYLSQPQMQSFPIVVFCTGSSSRHDITSIIHVHRYFLQEILDIGCGLLTVEQRGVEGADIDVDEFMTHYTCSNRLCDHVTVLEHLQNNKPLGWTGKFIFIGVSEGGPLVTQLTTYYSPFTIATLNWCGASDDAGESWATEIWEFYRELPWYYKIAPVCCSNFPKTFKEHCDILNSMQGNPRTDLEYFGMTYKYHEDIMFIFPSIKYETLVTPYLVVTGGNDSAFPAALRFLERAKNAEANVSCLHVQNMDHYIRRRPDVVQVSLRWLQERMQENFLRENLGVRW